MMILLEKYQKNLLTKISQCHQYGIKNFYLNSLKENESAWDFEIEGTKEHFIAKVFSPLIKTLFIMIIQLSRVSGKDQL